MREMVQWLRVPVALADNICTIERTHMKTNNCLYLQFQKIQFSFLASADTRYTCTTHAHKHTYTYNENKNNFEK